MNKSQIRVSIIKDITEAERLWNRFTSNKTIYDLWEFRYTFYQYFNYELFFYTYYIGDDLIGLIPLQYNSDEKYLESFGGEYMEENHIYLIDKRLSVEEMFDHIKQPCYLRFVSPDFDYITNWKDREYKYVTQLKNVKDHNDFIERQFEGKTRQTYRRQIKKLLAEHDIQIHEQEFKNVDILADYNIETFGEDSFLYIPENRKVFKDLTQIQKIQPFVMSFYIGGSVKAVSLNFMYNGIFTYLNAGVKKQEVSNLGKYVIFKSIDKACELEATVFDAGAESLGWKKEWHLTEVPIYTLHSI